MSPDEVQSLLRALAGRLVSRVLNERTHIPIDGEVALRILAQELNDIADEIR